MSRAKGKTGLSPSSFNLFQTCQRRYWHYKVNQTDIDPDSRRDSTALNVGKALHQCLEDTEHKLKGLTLAKVEQVCGDYEVDDYACMIFAMLSKYKSIHDKAGLEALYCEVAVETESFIGYIDVILIDSEGKWWIGDVKTAASFTDSLIPTLPHHPQLNLYASNYEHVAASLSLDPKKFQGCRYRLVTKSRLKRKDGESNGEFIGRLLKSVRAFDFPLPKETMSPGIIAGAHKEINRHIQKYKAIKYYIPNYSQCLQYYKPCEYFSQCHGCTFTEMKDKIEGLSSD